MEDEGTALDQRRIEAISFIIVDFETVTPKGYPPEPIELAAMRLTPGLQLDRDFVFNRLIKPPAHAPLTLRDTQQTGIRWHDLRDQPTAEVCLAAFEAKIQGETSVFVAHHASYEAALFQRYASFCPGCAAQSWIDTVALARYLVPGLAHYTLDTLARYFSLPIPVARHRALPDVELTVKVLLRLLEKRAQTSLVTLGDLMRIAGRRNGDKRQTAPRQHELFEW